MNHFETAIYKWGRIAESVIDFGMEAWQAVEGEGRTIRELSIEICGDSSLEDSIGRYIMAAKWSEFIRTHRIYSPLYETMRDWFSAGHYTELWKIFDSDSGDGYWQDIAMDAFEQCFVRNVADEVVKVKSVDWLRAKRSPEYSPAEMYHKFWKQAGRLLTEAYSELERKGLQATKRDRRRVRILKLALAEFAAEQVDA